MVGDRYSATIGLSFFTVFVLFALGYALSRMERATFIGGVLVHDPLQATDPLVAWAREAPNVIIVPSGGPQAAAALRQAEALRPGIGKLPLPIGFYELVAGGVDVRSGTEANAAAVAEVLRGNAKGARSGLPYIIGLAVFLSAYFLSARFAARAPGMTFLIAASGVLSAVLFYHRCTSCPLEIDILSLDPALVGTAYFSVAATAICLLPWLSTSFVPMAVLAVSGTTQSILFWGAHGSCSWCVSIFAIACFAVGRELRIPSVVASNTSLTSPKPVVLTLVSFAVGFAVVGYRASAPSPLNPYAAGSTSQELPVSHVADLGLRGPQGDVMTQLPMAVLVGSDSCPPCRVAARCLLEVADLNVLVANHSDLNIPKAGPFSFVWLSNRQLNLPTPTLILFDKSGRVVDSFVGWADDERFVRAIVDRIRTVFMTDGDKNAALTYAGRGETNEQE